MKKKGLGAGVLLFAAVAALASCSGRTVEETPAPVRPEPAGSIVDDLRRFLAAEAAYAGRNKGFFGEPPCLSAPATCLSGYDGPRFLDPAEAAFGVRRGYALTFLPGLPLAPEEVTAEQAAPGSLRGYAIVAVPTTSSLPAYCADSTGVVCARVDGPMSRPRDGRCPDDCPPLK
jgi:hypothetical protein